MAYLDYHSEWLDHNGKIITIDGIKHKIKVSTWKAVYPSEHSEISVFAEVLDKKCGHYVFYKDMLGDDWGTDVIASSPEYTAKVLELCNQA